MSRTGRKVTGPDLFVTGLAVIAIGVASLVLASVIGAGPITGRWAGAIVLGIPTGAVLVVLGVVKTLRDRR